MLEMIVSNKNGIQKPNRNYNTLLKYWPTIGAWPTFGLVALAIVDVLWNDFNTIFCL